MFCPSVWRFRAISFPLSRLVATKDVSLRSVRAGCCPDDALRRKPVPRILRQAKIAGRSLLWSLNRRLRNSITVSTRQGVFTISSKVDDPIGRSLYVRRRYELSLVTRALELLRDMQVIPPKGEGAIIDAGANNGVISIGMLHRGEVARSIAIEPEPENFSLLVRNVKQNGFEDSILCLNYAVSEQPGPLELELSETNLADHRVRCQLHRADPEAPDLEPSRAVIRVKAEPLDNLLGEAPEEFQCEPCLLWIDIQGYEGFAFLGAEKLLAKGIPVVSEIWPYGIERSGMSQEHFCSIAEEHWSSYWVLRRGRFVRYPIGILNVFFEELGTSGKFDNVVFTR